VAAQNNEKEAGVLNETHDPSRRSWVETANHADAEFPIQNLPLGIISPSGGRPRAGVAIGDRVLDLPAVLAAGLLPARAAEAAETARDETLNAMLALGRPHADALRAAIGTLLDAATPQHRAAIEPLLHPLSACELALPVTVRNYTDFFAGIHHARAAGALMHRGGDVLPANYKWVPIAYHGRASSVRVGTGAVRRPSGQILAGGEPSFGPSQRLDLELELGCFIARGNALGEPIPIAEAADHIAGLCLLNDWSARDIQRWEMEPLGPFLGKNFSTSISPWIVTAAALAPFRVPAMTREPGDPKPLPYLFDETDQREGGIDIDLEVLLTTETMRARGEAPHTVIRSNARYLYWTVAQMVAHHSSGGCNLLPGDLIGTGTISGPERDQLSSLLELTFAGREPCFLPNGETRGFLEDGDEVTFRARCRRPGHVSIGFGSCSGRIIPS
jgi:fumarylacetoacetase